MEDLEVFFDYKGRQWKGILTSVKGAGARPEHVWTLEVKGSNRIARGDLRYYENRGWTFYTRNGYIPELAAQFGSVVDEYLKTRI
jgi:hypothetical protein